MEEERRSKPNKQSAQNHKTSTTTSRLTQAQRVCIHNTTFCDDMISNLIQRITSGSVTVTVIVLNSEEIKTGNGNPTINYVKYFWIYEVGIGNP